MDPYHIYEFRSLEFSKDDLAKMSGHRLGFLVASGLAANDQVLFLKLYILSVHPPPKDSILAQISGNSSMICLRNLLAKTYEYMALFDKLNQKAIDLKDTELRPFTKMATKKIHSLRRDPIWPLVSKLRDKLTHHYDLDYIDPVETVKDFQDSYRFQAHINERSRNSFYIYAEEIGHLSHIFETEDEGLTHDQILAWLMPASRSLIELHERYLIKIHNLYLPGRRLKYRRIFVPDHYLWGRSTNIPLLFADDL